MHGQNEPDLENDAAANISKDTLFRAQYLYLYDWQTLYYAIIAEIRQIYGDIQQRFESEMRNGQLILHAHGWDGEHMCTPFTVLEFASWLEHVWRSLMNPGLVGRLENAVRMQNFTLDHCEEFGVQASHGHIHGKWHDLSPRQLEIELDESEGMMDVHEMSPDDVWKTLWITYAPIIQLSCEVELQKEIVFTTRRAEIIESLLTEDSPEPEELEEDETDDDGEALCIRTLGCKCRTVCRDVASNCACAKGRNQVKALIEDQQKIHDTVHCDHAEENRGPLPNHMLGAVTNDMAQLQIAAMANPEPYIIQAVFATSEAADRLDAQYLQQKRARANSSNIPLAYVPQTPQRVTQSSWPLGIHGADSGQRYPTFRPQATALLPPVYGPSSKVPGRKPVPKYPSIPKRSLQAPLEPIGRFDPIYDNNWPLSKPLPPSQQPAPFRQDVHDPVCVKVSKNSLVTKSCPEPYNVQNAQPENEFANWEPSYVGVGMGAPIKSKNPADPFNTPTKPRSGRFSMDSVSGMKTRYPSADLRNWLDKPYPPLPPSELVPEPEFIAPRPALKQRYVSAGGSAKLEDREAIEDFALPPAEHQGVTMPKAQFMQLLADAEMPDPAHGKGQSPARQSHEYAAAEGGERSSGHEPGSPRGQKRDRTGSSASLGLARLKRVFSRKNSDSD